MGRVLHAARLTVWTVLLAGTGACGTARFSRVAMEVPQGVQPGPPALGRSCAWHVLGVPLGAPSLDAAVVDALDGANGGREADRGPPYDALVEVSAEEQLGPLRRCVVVRGRPVTVGTMP